MAMEVADSGQGFGLRWRTRGKTASRRLNCVVCITVYNCAGARKKGVEAYMGLVDLASTSWGYWALFRRSGPYESGHCFFFSSILYIIRCLAKLI